MAALLVYRAALARLIDSPSSQPACLPSAAAQLPRQPPDDVVDKVKPKDSPAVGLE